MAKTRKGKGTRSTPRGEVVPGDVLAIGEATGHSHRTVGATVYMRDDGVREFIGGGESVGVVHEEHNPLTLPGRVLYNSGVVQQYDPLTEAVSAVKD